MKPIKYVSYRVKDPEQALKLDTLSFYYEKSLQEIIDLAVEEYYQNRAKQDPNLDKIKKLQQEER